MAEPLPEDTLLRHLLDELPPAEARACEDQLAADATARAALHAEGERLRQWATDDLPAIAPAPATWEHLAARLELSTAARPLPDHARWWHSLPLWRAAALLFLALHGLWLLPWGKGLRENGEALAPAGGHHSPGGPASDSDRALVTTTPPSPGEGATEIERLRSRLETREVEVEILRDALGTARDATRLAQRERERLAVRLGAFFRPEAGRSQLTLVELRPRGVGASGFLENLQDALLNPDRGPRSRGAVDEEAFAGTTPGEDNPAALAVWRDDLQQGFLNLYSLPAPAEGQQHTLWVRGSGEGDAFVAVGTLPPPESDVLLLDFTVPGTEAFHPGAFLITEEPAAGAPQPTGPVVLEGP
ncbi:MAG: anti-sigma factor domain-containing protein [Opitutales bacterium]